MIQRSLLLRPSSAISTRLLTSTATFTATSISTPTSTLHYSASRQSCWPAAAAAVRTPLTPLIPVDGHAFSLGRCFSTNLRMRSAAGVGGEVPGVDTVKGGEGGGGGGGVAGGVGGGVGVGAGGGGESVDPVRKELEGKDREIIDLKDKYLRSIADYRNLQDRSKREIGQTRDFAIAKFATDLLDTVDNLERALGTVTVPERNTNGTRVVDGNGGGKDSGVDGGGDGNDGGSDGGLRDLYGGVEMTGRVLMGTLKRFGVEVVNPGGEGNGTKGERFDPRIHEALFSARVEGREDGEVFRTEVKGYLLNGRVIRAAKVGVVKNS